MASPKEYFADDLLHFTVNDLHEVENPENVTEKHLEVLRDLMRQRDETSQSNLVDENELCEKPRHICSFGSTPVSSGIPTPPPDGPERVERDLRSERESYDALVQEGGRPSHPIHLKFDILDNPGKYEDIISYWRSVPGTGRLLFLAQLDVWREFCRWQRTIRQYYRNRFPDYQKRVLERRRRHGLKGDVELHREPDQQSRLNNWMEYQDYECQLLEGEEKDIEQAQEKSDSAQKELKEAGVPGFDWVYDPDNFDNYYGLAAENSGQIWSSWEEMRLAEEEMRLAGGRLEAAKSDDSRENVERSALIKLAQKEVEPAQKRLDESRKSHEAVKLRGAVLSTGFSLSIAKEKLGQRKILLEWINQQLLVITSESTTSSTRSEALRDHSAPRVSEPERSSEGSRYKRNQSTAHPIFSPVHSSRVFNTARKKPGIPRQKRSTLRDASQSTEKAAIEHNIVLRRSERISKLSKNTTARNPEHTSLCAVRSSRVSKARKKVSGGMQSIELRLNDTKSSPATDRRTRSTAQLTPFSRRQVSRIAKAQGSGVASRTRSKHNMKNLDMSQILRASSG